MDLDDGQPHLDVGARRCGGAARDRLAERLDGARHDAAALGVGEVALLFVLWACCVACLKVWRLCVCAWCACGPACSACNAIAPLPPAHQPTYTHDERVRLAAAGLFDGDECDRPQRYKRARVRRLRVEQLHALPAQRRQAACARMRQHAPPSCLPDQPHPPSEPTQASQQQRACPYAMIVPLTPASTPSTTGRQSSNTSRCVASSPARWCKVVVLCVFLVMQHAVGLRNGRRHPTSSHCGINQAVEGCRQSSAERAP